MSELPPKADIRSCERTFGFRVRRETPCSARKHEGTFSGTFRPADLTLVLKMRFFGTSDFFGNGGTPIGDILSKTKPADTPQANTNYAAVSSFSNGKE
jgi:hypothetical protein